MLVAVDHGESTHKGENRLGSEVNTSLGPL